MYHIRGIFFIIFILVVISGCGAVTESADTQPVIPKDIASPTDSTETSYNGLTIDAARDLAAENGVAFRVVELDGVPQPTTRDFRPGRINATVVDGIVTDYTIEGKE